MPILKAISTGKTVASLHQVLYYVARKDKEDEEEVLKTGLGCSSKVDIAFKEMMFNKRHYNKANGKMYKHYAQSFEPNTITKEKAHEIGVKFAEENFLNKGFRAYVVTHIDKDHIHNHIVIDNVSFETGLKYVELDEKDLKKKQYKDRELKAHENTLENLKKSSDEIAFYYGIDIVEKEGKSINIYNKNKYKAVERGFINNVATEWNNILFDETTNLINFQEVLESKGIYTKVDEEFKQIYFTNNKANFDKRHSKKVLSLYKIASVFDYQFKNANEVNIFDYDKSIKLLSKGKAKESELELEENTLIAGDKDKKEPIKELEKEVKKDFLAEETDKLKENIEEYNNSVNSTIDSFLQSLGDTETKLNVSVSLKDFNTLKAEINNKIKDTKLSIARGSAETIFKNTLEKWSKENISKDTVIEKLIGTTDIVSRKIKNTLKDMPQVEDIKSIEELQKATKLVEDTKKENLQKLENIGKKYFFTDFKEKINNFIRKVINFNSDYTERNITLEKKEFIELEKTLIAEYRAKTEEKDRGKDINSLYSLEDYIKESEEEKEREQEQLRQRTLGEMELLKKKKKTTTTTTVTEVEKDIDITNITDNEDIEKTRETEEKLRQYAENKKKENRKKNDKTYIAEDEEKEKEQEMEI